MRHLPLAAALCLVLQGGANAATHTIVIEGMEFRPRELTVARGDRVLWRNQDLVPHTATAAGRFDSGPLQPGASGSWTAGAAGRLDCVCRFHPGMRAVLIVK